jgi:hypothetical protein
MYMYWCKVRYISAETDGEKQRMENAHKGE